MNVTLKNGLTLSLEEHGDSAGPALVLRPGPTDSWRSYQPTLDWIPDSIRTIAISQRGHGDSEKPATGYRVADFAADVVALLDALEIERAVLAGHSGSCLVARRVALDAPGRVAGLVLEASPTTLRDDPAFEEFVTSVVSGLRDPIDPEFVRSFVADTSSDKVGHELIQTAVTEMLKVPAHVWQEVFADVLKYDDMAELERITAPEILIWGDADGLVAWEMQAQLAAAMSHAEILIYPRAGHTPRWDNPARFAADIASFVGRSARRGA